MEEKGRSKFEVFLVSIVVVLSIALGVAFYSGRARVDKGRLLMQELSMFRSAVATFNMLNHRLPNDLKELVDSTYDVGSEKKSFTAKVEQDGLGRLLDPFGNAYHYDPSAGWVNSTTEGYERW